MQFGSGSVLPVENLKRRGFAGERRHLPSRGKAARQELRTPREPCKLDLFCRAGSASFSDFFRTPLPFVPGTEDTGLISYGPSPFPDLPPMARLHAEKKSFRTA